MAIATTSWHALGTSVRVLTTAYDRAWAAAATVEEVLNDVDETCSRFRADSELSRLNARAGTTVSVSPLLERAIATALRGARLSGGAVDPTVGQAIRRIGYEQDFALVPATGRRLYLSVQRVPGWQAVELDLATHRVRVPAGCELDLGSTGKALAADLAAEAAQAAAGGGVLVGLGGDIATAGTAPPGGWNVLAAEDCRERPDGEGQTVGVAAGALATSSTTVRRWVRGKRSLHHIVDPATGLPAQGPWRTATVAAATCVDANIAATAAIVRGEAAIPWLEDYRLDARLVRADGAVVRVGRWPVPDSPVAGQVG
jgi:thiamine biosynthesis lipoprotein